VRDTPFAALLRQQRLAAGLTQGALAERAGLAARTIQDLELGVARPRRDTVHRLVAALSPPPEIRASFEAVTPTPRARARRSEPTSAAAASVEWGGRQRSPPIDTQVGAASGSRLPAPLTSLIGRERDLAALADLLSTTRLLTLTGVGGVGKTRLAVEAARAAQPGYQDGVWLIELAALGEAALVPQAVAKGLGIAEQPRRPPVETLVEALATRHLLLVLDNCEHLLDGCATLVQRLLAACQGLRVLATSREPLGVAGEVVWRVPSLAVPESKAELGLDPGLIEYGAVRLFRDRARLVQPSFVLGEASSPAVVEICRRVDGIPLAIELAAARVPFLTTRQIADRLHDTLGLLTHGPRTALPRHRTLRAALDWSYDLLAEPERVLLRRLAVFAGGWTLEAAEAVCSGDGLHQVEILDLLSRIVDASLAVAEERDGEARYRLLEPVRQYALEHLRQTVEEVAVRDRHACWCLTLAEQAEPELWMADQIRWFERLATDHDNLRAALTWSVRAGRGTEIGLRLAGALQHFWIIGGYWGEGRQWLDETLRTAANDQGPSSVKALVGAALLATRQYDVERATTLSMQAFSLAQESGDTRNAVLALLARGSEIQQRDYEKARRTHDRALALARDHTDQLVTAIALDRLGRLAELEGDFSRAEKLLDEALALHRARGDRISIAWTLAALCLVARRQGAYERAISLGEESLALYRGLRDTSGLAFALHNVGRVAHLQHDLTRARSAFEESVRLWRDIGSREQAVRSLEGLAAVITAEGRPDRAVHLLAATAALDEVLGRAHSPAEQDVYEQLLAAARTDLNEEEFASAYNEGRAMSFEQAVAYALERTAEA
jgi:non-specific serine/threonine protein kinase